MKQGKEQPTDYHGTGYDYTTISVRGQNGDPVYELSVRWSAVGNADTDTTCRLVGVPFCPDLLRWKDIGVADNLRGHVVRGFFWLMRTWR